MPDMLPDHMDRWSRNQRLYETLKGMGLFVSPIPEPDDPTKIRELIVAADLPFAECCPEQATQCGVVGAVKRPEISNVVEFHPRRTRQRGRFPIQTLSFGRRSLCSGSRARNRHVARQQGRIPG